MEITIKEIEEKILGLHLQAIVQKAYEKGVEDGMKRFTYPPVLRNSHLAEILQIAMPTVIKVTSNPSFPRLQTIKGRYPRDLVFEWIESNSTYLRKVI
ncbi:hypothetical protein M4D55_23170 [Metabacillus idriensis]|uniref:hypothetical protein n=1 Tax=Metabacillus idriensis TaxID=324768 RepID=UPI00203DD541|nr:hypothetical protein [Metabacillus idriensis]MCM3598663.1 hypothetical protein [Metabacillus idriensis]